MVIVLYECPIAGFFYTNESYYKSLLDRYRYSSNKNNKSEIDLMNKMRMLWEQHIAWTRAGVMSIIEDLPDVDFAVKRLLRNPQDFEMALKTYYGDAAASKFSDLLKNHLVIAAELVKAAKNGDNKTAEDAEKRWYGNTDEIAEFLAEINPYWSYKLWKTMLNKHLSLTKSEADAILNKNYEQSIALYDEIEKQTLEMADMMTKGIVKQFPHMFTE